jgi:hypothetical protein
MMFVYSGLPILVNRRSLPPSVRITGFRTATMVWSVLLFGTASVIAIADQWDNIKELVGLVVWMLLAGLAALLGFL